MDCDETEHVYKIRVDGTQIEEWYSLETHRNEAFVAKLWLKHLQDEGGFRARFAETFAQHLEVDNICQDPSERQAVPQARRVTPAEVEAAEVAGLPSL